ncbi:MAG: glycosyltransferase family 4 protein [Anaerolineae bacterium]
MKMIFICETVDENHQVLASTAERIKYFALHPDVEHVDVIALRVGDYDLPANVKIHTLKHKKNPNVTDRFRTLYKFYRIVVHLCRHTRINVIYCYMGAIYPILLFPIKLLFRPQICLWWGHTIAVPITKLSVHFFVDKWFTANKTTAPLNTRNLHLVGQGVDQDLFKDTKLAKKFDFITVGRISPVKRTDLIIRALSLCRSRIGKDVSLLICGNPLTEQDLKYKEDLISMISGLRLEDNIEFAGKVLYKNMPYMYNQSRCFVFATPGGVGKALLEAMSCALPMIVAEPNMTDFFPKHIADLVLCHNNAESIASSMVEMINRSEDERREIGQSLRQLVEEKYSLQNLTDRIVKIIGEPTTDAPFGHCLYRNSGD